MIYLLHHLLAESAQRWTDNPAVSMGHHRLSYGDLDKMAGRLAQVLRESGVMPGNRVGIWMPKSNESIVSIFGILKAGGVYVPIDPKSPIPRAVHIIKDCGIRHLITSEAKLSGLHEEIAGQADFPVEVVLTTDEGSRDADRRRAGARVIAWEAVKGSGELRQEASGVDSDLAYILYTSGSTGMPKGVMISHRAALTFINWTHDFFKITEKDVVASHAPLHFDLSIFDIFTTIKAGGMIVLVPELLSTFPVTLSEFIRDQRITVWYSVPSALILMLARGDFVKHMHRDLRLILFAGEVFPLKYLRTLKEGTGARLFNLYGPTETNVCTYYEVAALLADQTKPIPIGRPIDNYELFLVSDDGNHPKPGEVGELFARGPGLMAGYWGDPEKSNLVLVPNPFQPAFEDKVCRTGDLAIQDDEGNYHYLGRRDHMVKSKGYRIELGEIETTLYSHPKVTEAAVIAIISVIRTIRLIRCALFIGKKAAQHVFWKWDALGTFYRLVNDNFNH